MPDMGNFKDNGAVDPVVSTDDIQRKLDGITRWFQDAGEITIDGGGGDGGIV
ncbi:MAG: hypothetical protein FWF44_00565 [Defluviitaleaceae bacterium]|nr:hypothetical protein [Defluviitaleaceae bacterium]